jgi:hypothetical protein
MVRIPSGLIFIFIKLSNSVSYKQRLCIVRSAKWCSHCICILCLMYLVYLRLESSEYDTEPLSL